MKKSIKKIVSVLLTVTMMGCLFGCGASETAAPSAASEETGSTTETEAASTDAAGESASAEVHPGEGATKLGVLLVGARDDMGYNQQLYECCMGAKEKLGLEVLVKDNVPEDSSCVAVMQEMIAQGCTLVYATSIGHREYMEEVAKEHPEVAFYTCNTTGNQLDNIVVLCRDEWDAAYVNGVAAGMMTKSNQLGYVASFQIPVVLADINAFTLGAQSVNPDVTVHAIFTGSWSDVGLQTNAVDGMASQDVDVVAIFQDYTKAITEHCEELGIYSCGYHCDTSELGPNTFLIGALDAFVKQYATFQDAIDGKFEPGIVRGGYPEGMAANTELAAFCPDEVKEAVAAAEEKLTAGEKIFTGPIEKQDGTMAFEEGVEATYEQLDGTDFFVKGVVGEEN